MNFVFFGPRQRRKGYLIRRKCAGRSIRHSAYIISKQEAYNSPLSVVRQLPKKVVLSPALNSLNFLTEPHKPNNSTTSFRCGVSPLVHQTSSSFEAKHIPLKSYTICTRWKQNEIPNCDDGGTRPKRFTYIIYVQIRPLESERKM